MGKVFRNDEILSINSELVTVYRKNMNVQGKILAYIFADKFCIIIFILFSGKADYDAIICNKILNLRIRFKDKKKYI